MAERIRAAVIGGGAAGLMAACELTRLGVEAAVLERQPRVGRKLLATGNGRCNFTNSGAAPEKYISSTGKMDALLAPFGFSEIAGAFERLGVPSFGDAEGRRYPMSNTAASVLDALRLYLDERDVKTLCGFDVVKIVPKDGGFVIRAADGRAVECDKVIYCPGGMASPKNGGVDASAPLKALGHAFTERLPGISPIETDTKHIRGLKGVRAKACLSLYDGDRRVRSESGEILFTDSGVSGICAMDLSLFVHGLTSPRLEIDFTQGADRDDIMKRTAVMPLRDAELLLNGMVPRAVSERVVRRALNGRYLTCGELNGEDIDGIYAQMSGFSLDIKRVSGFENAQVTIGGADMRRFDPETLESKLVKGLYVAGEICDVAGLCGGYNLHWAWVSAIKAARALKGGA